MPLSVDGLTIARATIFICVVIMLCHSYMAIGFGRELRRGKNGISLALMFQYATLANEHFYLAVTSWLALNDELHAYYEFAIWLWLFLTLALIAASFIVLFIEFYQAAHAKSG